MPSIKRFANAMTILHLQFFVLIFTVFVFKIAANIDKGVFFIFIGSNQTDTKKMFPGDDFKSLKLSQYYDDYKPSVVYIHGWQGKFERRASQGVIDAYLVRGDHNIIFLDWSQQAKKLNYMKTAREMNETAENMAQMLVEMRRAGFDLRKFHLIGYSFGAHFAGQIGDYLKKNHNIWLTRITGLEPAGPMFKQQRNNKVRDNSTVSLQSFPPLQKGQAKFVDIIHTDAGLLGTHKSTGDIDFWPNGGKAPQPGCDLKTCYTKTLDPCVICSHDRAWKFYTETVKNGRTDAFAARPCNRNAINFNRRTCNGPESSRMGFYANQTPKKFYGNYFVETRPTPPYTMS